MTALETNPAAITARGRGRDLESLAAALLVFVAVAFNLCFLLPEVTLDVPPLNDDVLHVTNLTRTLSAIALHQDPTDPWLANIALGSPLFHYYQHLPYIIPALLQWFSLFLLKVVPASSILLNRITYLLLSLFPLSIYWAMRRFGFARAPSAFAALCSCLVSANGLPGFDFNSYVWRGYGLYTQLWGMFLLPPALAQGYAALKQGRGYFLAVLLLAALLLSHLMLGYIALVSLILMALVIALGRTPALSHTFRKTIGRLALLLILAALVTAYLVIPFIADSAYMNRSTWVLAGAYDAYGWQWTLGALVTGQLFDAGRLPVFTLLVALGLIVCVRRWREERYRIPVILLGVWLLLYFGRSTWGALLNFLPLGGDLQLHRFIAGVHLAGILLIGLGLGAIWEGMRASRRTPACLALAVVVTVVWLLPAYAERVGYLEQNTLWKSQTGQAFAAEEQDLTALFDALRSLPSGRVYAGLANNWGKDYRIGTVPMYAQLQTEGFDMVGYLYHALSLNADAEVLFNDALPEQYNLFNIRYVVVPTNFTVPTFYKPLQTFGRHKLYQVKTTGYFDLVDSESNFVGTKSDWFPAASAWLKSSMLADKQAPAIRLGSTTDETQNAQPLAMAPTLIAQQPTRAFTPAGHIAAEAVGSNSFQADVEVQRASTLMLKATYHPNWHAYVDGVETPTTMLMPSYIGVPVIAGTHHILFEYRPQAYRGWLIWLGLITLLGLGLVEWQSQSLGKLRDRLKVSRWLAPVDNVTRAAQVKLARAASALESNSVRGKTRLGLYFLFLGVYLMSTAGHFWSTDHVAVYLTAQSLVERHNLAIKPINDTLRGPDGNYYGVFGLGQSILSIPLYLVGKGVDSLGSPFLQRYFGGIQLGDWGGTVPIFFVNLFNPLVAPLTCVLFYLLSLRLGFSRRASLLTTLLFGLSTLTWVAARDFLQHSLETLLLLSTLYVLVAHRDRLSPRLALYAGAILALGVLTRLNLLLTAPLVAAYMYYLIYASRLADTLRPSPYSGRLARLQSKLEPKALRCVIVFALPSAFVFLILLYLNMLRYGDPLAFNRTVTAHGFALSNLLEGLYGNLLSPGRSLFLYSPPMLLGVWFYRRFFNQHRAEALLFLALAAAYLLFYSGYGDWMGGWSWGPRFMIAIVPYLILPAAYAFEEKWATRAAVVLALLGAGIQILGIVVNASYVYWDWGRMNLNPPESFLFIPAISAIPTHLQNLLAGRHIDLWLVWVYQQFGARIFLLTIAPPLALVALGLHHVSNGRVWRSLLRFVEVPNAPTTNLPDK